MKWNTLNISLGTNTIEGDRNLLNLLTFENIEEVDLEELLDDSEGNAEGTISIFLKTNGGFDNININGEHFSPLLIAYNTWNADEQKVLISELKEKLEREMK